MWGSDELLVTGGSELVATDFKLLRLAPDYFTISAPPGLWLLYFQTKHHLAYLNDFRYYSWRFGIISRGALWLLLPVLDLPTYIAHDRLSERFGSCYHYGVCLDSMYISYPRIWVCCNWYCFDIVALTPNCYTTMALLTIGTFDQKILSMVNCCLVSF